jgi:hypothetical protein
MTVLVEPGHEIVSGTIGMGKSFWILWKIIQSFLCDRPCCYIDPRSDTYLHLLAFFHRTKLGRELWQRYQHRIIFLDLVSPADYAVAFNILEPMSGFFFANPDKIALLATSLVSHLKRELGWELGMANRMEAIMMAAIGLLVSAGSYTLAEIPALFMQTKSEDGTPERFNPFTQKLLDKCHHAARWFWDYQWANWSVNDRKEWTNSTNNQVFRYLFDERALVTTCASDNATLDFRRLIDNRCWLFVNIPYQYLSETITTLIGNMLITKIFYACMQREPTYDYRLILDEARFFNTGPLDVILETARAYRLWLTLVVQSLDQMARNREGRIDYRLKETALNNAKYLSVFHTISDAELFASLMVPLTGQIQSAVEMDQNRWRFMSLVKREVVLWDRDVRKPQRWITPDVSLPEVSAEELMAFEAEHIKKTGRPIAQIRQEIATRQAEVQALINKPRPNTSQQQTPPRQHPRNQMGRRI